MPLFFTEGKGVHCNEIGWAQSPQKTYSKSIERSSKRDSATQPSHINVPYTDNVPWKAGLELFQTKIQLYLEVASLISLPSWILTRDVSRQRDGCFRDLSRSTSLRNMLNESDLKRPDKEKRCKEEEVPAFGGGDLLDGTGKNSEKTRSGKNIFKKH